MLSPRYSASNNGDSSHVNNNNPTSPSRSAARKVDSHHKRSCLEYGRLCVLRNKGRFWKRVVPMVCLMLVSTYTIIIRFDLQQGIRATSNEYYHNAVDGTRIGNIGGSSSDRILFQNLPYPVNPAKWQKLSGKDLFERAHFQAKPLVMGFVVDATGENGLANYNTKKRHHYQLEKIDKSLPRLVSEHFDTVQIHPNKHTVIRGNKKVENWTYKNALVSALGTGEQRKKEIDENSKDYRKYQPDAPPEGCEPQYDWQSKSFPNCNAIHETDILTRARTLNLEDKPESVLVARGGYRDVWLVEDNDVLDDGPELTAMKTLLYEHPWSERNMDRHRRDALATDRLTGSPNALNLFGYCANTGIYEFANGGSLEDAVDDEDDYGTWNSTTKMKYAYQVALAISDVHNIDMEGLPSMSHTDISMSQFVSKNGGEDFQINDFNRARFLYRDVKDHSKLCPFEVGSNKGKFRSPEEYAYEPETVAVDTYSMGNIFYVILTGKYPFEDVDKQKVRELVMKGERTEIDEEYLNSSDPLIKALITAIKMCWVQLPSKRATSREVQQFLQPFATGGSKETHERHLKAHHHHNQ